MLTFDYFDRVYCIHLPNPGRRKAMQAELDRLGIRNVEYVHARPPAAGFRMTNMRRAGGPEFGANLSHVKAVLRAVADGAERPLFLEDDVVFRLDAATLLATALAELPAWDVLYMGGHPRETVSRFSPSLVKVGRFSFAEAYAISRKALLPFLEMWTDRIAGNDAMYDFILGEFAASHESYCVYPLLCCQPTASCKTGPHSSQCGCGSWGYWPYLYLVHTPCPFPLRFGDAHVIARSATLV